MYVCVHNICTMQFVLSSPMTQISADKSIRQEVRSGVATKRQRRVSARWTNHPAFEATLVINLAPLCRVCSDISARVAVAEFIC